MTGGRGNGLLRGVRKDGNTEFKIKISKYPAYFPVLAVMKFWHPRVDLVKNVKPLLINLI